MRLARRSRLLVLLLLLLVAALVLLWLVWWRTDDTPPEDRHRGEGVGEIDGEQAASFSIHGDVDELIVPGRMVPLDLAVTNPNGFDLDLTELTVEVRDVSAPNADPTHPCTPDDFTVKAASLTSTITLAANSTATLSSLDVPRDRWPQIGMLNRPINQDGCQGASLALAYAGEGRR